MKYRAKLLYYNLTIFLYQLFGYYPSDYLSYTFAIYATRRKEIISRLDKLEKRLLELKEESYNEPEILERIDRVLESIKISRAKIL